MHTVTDLVSQLPGVFQSTPLKVRVQTDGGLKTGLDVIKAAILGAESFGSAPHR